MIEHRAFFGDGEKTFAFPNLETIKELEAASGHAIGALHRRFLLEEFSLSDIEQVIRLGLIGGGTTPADAARLVATYLIGRPLRENLDLASDIISALFYGAEAINDALEQVPA